MQWAILDEIHGTFKFKNSRIEAPEYYLGAKRQKKDMNGLQCWTIACQDSVVAAVKNVEETKRNLAGVFQH